MVESERLHRHAQQVQPEDDAEAAIVVEALRESPGATEEVEDAQLPHPAAPYLNVHSPVETIVALTPPVNPAIVRGDKREHTPASTIDCERGVR